MVNDLIVHLVFVDMFGLFSLIVNSYVDVWKEEETTTENEKKGYCFFCLYRYIHSLKEEDR